MTEQTLRTALSPRVNSRAHHRDISTCDIINLLSTVGANVPPGYLLEQPSEENYVKAEYHNQGCIKSLVDGDFSEATRHGIKAITALPLWIEPYSHLGYALAKSGEIEKAISLLTTCTKLYPYYDPAHVNLISIMLKLNNLDGALEACMAMEKYIPGNADNLFRIGTLHLRAGRYEQAKAWLDRGLNPRFPQQVTRMLPFGALTLPKLTHDLKQMERLLGMEALPPSYWHVVGEYQRLIHEAPRPSGDARWSSEQDMSLCSERISKIAPFYRRVTYIEEAPRQSASLIREGIDVQAVENEYNSHDKLQYAIIDDFLTPSALQIIRNYLLNSTIWHNDGQEGRTYMGAYRDMGLRAPIMDQLIDELKERFSSLLGSNDLEEVWAYRNAINPAAVGPHADFSKININLWLAPDIATQEDGTGGLILYDRQAAGDLKFEDYNDDTEKISSIIKGADQIVIPHKENRAMLFDPTIFHESDRGNFGENYEDWRINLTFLFGDRHLAPGH